MRVETYTQPQLFLDRVGPLLEENESANSLILGIVRRLVEHADWEAYSPYLGVVEADDGRELLIAVMTPPHNLLLAGGPRVPEAAVDALIDSLNLGDWSVPGVMAEKQLAGRFAARWSQRVGQSFQVRTLERLYELRQVIPPVNPPAGSLRRAMTEDEGLVARWLLAFMREAVRRDDPEEARKTAANRTASGDVFLWDDQGPVSMAIRSRPTARGYTVSYVYTPPDLRGQGYASACVAALSQQLLDSGKLFCNLFTDLSNPTSNDIYQKIGYRPVCDFTEYTFEQAVP